METKEVIKMLLGENRKLQERIEDLEEELESYNELYHIGRMKKKHEKI